MRTPSCVPILLVLSLLIPIRLFDAGFVVKPVFLVVALVALVRIGRGRLLKLNAFDVLFLCFITYGTATVFWSYSPDHTFRFVLGSLLIFITYYIVRYELTLVVSIDKVLDVSLRLFLIASIAFYVLKLLGLGPEFIGPSYGYELDRGMIRMSGTFWDPNIFALALTVPIFYFTLGRSSLLWAVVSFLCLFATISRGGIIGVAVGLVAALLVSERRKDYTLPFIFVSVVATAAYAVSQFGDIVQTRLSDAHLGTGRFDMWLQAVQVFFDAPVQGLGLFTYRAYSEAVLGKSMYLHNTFLEIFVETGIIGGTVYIMACVLVLVRAYQLTDKGHAWLFCCWLSLLVQMNALSVIINEVVFLVVALISAAWLRSK